MKHPSSTPPSGDPTTPAPALARWLWRLIWLAAVACWFLSLALPGFVVRGSPEPWYGIKILLMGLPFGWWGMGWAVYANVLFWIVLIRVAMSKPAGIWTTVMLLLAATMPFFAGPMDNEASMTGIPVTAWGWGALVWLTSLLLAAVCNVQPQRLRTFLVLCGLVGLGGIYGLVALLHTQQWEKANAQEREMYLGEGTAFAVAPLCGVPLTWPEAPLIGPDEIPELTIDPALKAINRPYLSLPLLEKYQSDGFAWLWYSIPAVVEVQVRNSAPPPRFSLQAQAVGQGAVIRLVQNSTGQILYEQHLHRQYFHSGRNGNYCPINGLHENYKQAILRALGQTGSPIYVTSHAQLQTEIAHEPCDPGDQNIDGIDGLRTWDGRQAIFSYGLNGRKFFCSVHYIASAELYAPSNTSTHLLGRITVFDRPTLRPLARFDFTKTNSCPCSNASRDLITGVRISDREATIETTQGNIQTSRTEISDKRQARE